MIPLAAGYLFAELMMQRKGGRMESRIKPKSIENVKAIRGAEVDHLLALPNVAAFLRVIRYGETSADNDKKAYQVLNGGGSFAAPPWNHPGGSRAAGAYQFMSNASANTWDILKKAPNTWDILKKALNLADFSPVNQDRAALGLIAWLGALEAVKAGDTRAAYGVLSRPAAWPSLPGGSQCAVYAKMKNRSDGVLLAPEVAADFIYGKWGGRATGN